MQNSLRSLVLASVVLAVAAFAAQTAKAATAINVLFPFTVGNQTCPAGHYQVIRDSNSYTVKLIGATKSFVLAIHPGDPAPGESRVVLKFEELGSGRVLSAIQYGSLITSRINKESFSRETGSEIVLGK